MLFCLDKKRLLYQNRRHQCLNNVSDFHIVVIFSHIRFTNWRHYCVRFHIAVIFNDYYTLIVAFFDQTDAEQKQKQTCCNPTVHSSIRRCSMQSASGLKKLSSCGGVNYFSLEINLVLETEFSVFIHKLIIVSEGFGYWKSLCKQEDKK